MVKKERANRIKKRSDVVVAETGNEQKCRDVDVTRPVSTYLVRPKKVS